MSLRPEPPSISPASGEPAWTTRRLLDWIRSRLETRQIDSPRLCAEMLLAEVIGCERLRLYMDPDRPASEPERVRLRELVGRALRHEPVQYLLGRGWFFGREFEVGPAVLVPRPSSETLVQEALSIAKSLQGEKPLRVLDLCTGSGCIGISLAAESRGRVRRGASPLPEPEEREAPPAPSLQPIEVVATDLSAAALAVAAANARRHGVSDRIELLEGDLFGAVPPSERRSFDLICANPPYISDAEWERLDPTVREHEPAIALRGGRDGLDLLRRIVAEAPAWLRPGGAMLLELQFDQGPPMRGLLSADPWRGVRILKDHEGHDRVAVAERP
jgi:release factor glutamine methyltransferase